MKLILCFFAALAATVGNVEAAITATVTDVWAIAIESGSDHSLQISEPDHQITGGYVFAPLDKPPQFQPAAKIVFDGLASDSAIIRASNSQREPIQIHEVGPQTYLVFEPGLVYVDVVAVDFEAKTLDSLLVKIHVRGPPGPDTPDDPDDPGPDNPEPTPPDNVPADEFDNIGQRVAQWSAGLPNRPAYAEAYRNASQRLANDPTATNLSVAVQLVDSLRKRPEAAQFAPFRDKLNADLNKRPAMDRFTFSRYLAAVAAGLKAGQ